MGATARSLGGFEVGCSCGRLVPAPEEKVACQPEGVGRSCGPGLYQRRRPQMEGGGFPLLEGREKAVPGRRVPEAADAPACWDPEPGPEEGGRVQAALRQLGGFAGIEEVSQYSGGPDQPQKFRPGFVIRRTAAEQGFHQFRPEGRRTAGGGPYDHGTAKVVHVAESPDKPDGERIGRIQVRCEQHRRNEPGHGVQHPAKGAECVPVHCPGEDERLDGFTVLMESGGLFHAACPATDAQGYQEGGP